MGALCNSSFLTKLWTCIHLPVNKFQCAFCKPTPKFYRPLSWTGQLLISY